jgi:hypothetical protein
MAVAVCADVGSTFTKVAAVDLDTGTLLATAEHPTTVDTDVLHGLDAAVSQLGHWPSTMDVCSSAGGGLRLAVVGYEELVTAEAGHRVGLSAGARVVHVSAGKLDRTRVSALKSDRPDIVLLVGGTDGGNADVLRHNAKTLAGVKVPVARQCRGSRRGARDARAIGDRSRERVAAHRRAQSRAGPRGDPGRVPASRHRRKAPFARLAFRVAGARTDARHRAHRGRAARRHRRR